MASQSAVDCDHLKLANNIKIMEMLQKYGEQEDVIYSGKLIKINKRERSQTRTLLITNKAIYNIKGKNYNNPQRRINLKDISAITLSVSSLEFTINIPNEYDYRFKANDNDQRQKIINIISNQYKILKGKDITITKITTMTTIAYTVNKDVARLRVE